MYHELRKRGTGPSRTLPVVIALTVLAASGILASSVWGLASHRAQVIADTEARTQNLARIFASHAANRFGEIARTLEPLARKLSAPGMLDERNESALLSLLREHEIVEPRIGGLGVIDPRGMAIATTLAPGRKLDLSDRPFFAAHQRDPSPALAIGAPVISRISGRPMIPLSRRLSGPDGQFLGVLASSLSLDAFADLYASVALGPGSIIELVGDSGVVLLRRPEARTLVGSSAEAWSRFAAPARDQALTMRIAFPSDGIERIVSTVRVEGYPLFARVAISLPHALGPWRDQLTSQGIATGIAILGLLALSFVLLRQYSRLAESEASTRRNAEILDKTVASMADAVLVVDAGGKTIFSNPAAQRLFGSGPDIGSAEWQKTYHRFKPDGTTPYPAAETPIGRAIRGEDVDNLEIVLRRAGETDDTHIIASGRPIRDESGALTGAVLVYRDVTAAKETERRLQQSQKMDAIGQLTGGIAHDFNNLLTVVTGTIDILAGAVAHNPKLAAIAAMISQAADRGAELTKHLLAFARRQPLQPRETDLNALVIDTAKLLRPALGEQIEIESMLEDEAWPVLIDPGLLTNVLLNLAVNARDAMPRGGKLTLETGNVILDEAYVRSNPDVKPGPYVMLAVSDTGSGIPAALRDKVFEPFFTTKEPGKGTGLGLSMVYGFVKQSAGHIKIYSEEGHGTAIKLYLPRAGEQVRWLKEMLPQPAIEGGREMILVVEDDELVRNYVLAQLASLGYATLPAADGAGALALVRAGQAFDLLFTDVVLPGGMNGRALADEIRKLRPRLKVLYTSGYTEDAIVHHGRLDPDVLVLSKPYRKADLARMIRLALAAGKGPAAAGEVA